ncbi:MAG: SDR family oxidoreductase [Sphingopyxis sp.]
MDISGAVCVVTGGAGGIGQALARALLAGGAQAVVIADLPGAALDAAAIATGAHPIACNVAHEPDVQSLVAQTQDRFGPITLFCSNAGVLEADADLMDATSASNAAWERSWAVNVMAHVYAARACLPGMKARGHGHFLHTISAAGLLSQIGSGPYSTTKHAAIGFAEHLAIAHRDDGIRVSMLCPQAVDTAMIRIRGEDQPHPARADGILSPDDVAAITIAALRDDAFLILPHANVADYMANKARDYPRWIGGMAKMRRGY